MLAVALIVGSAFLISRTKKQTYSRDFVDTPVALNQLDSRIVDIKENENKFSSEVNNAVIEFNKNQEINNGEIALADINVDKRPSLKFSVKTDNTLESSLEDNKVKYNNQSEDYTIIYQSYKDYLKEDIILHTEKSQREFEFTFNSNFTLKQSNEGGIEIKQDDQLLYYVYPVIAEDANGDRISYRYEIDKSTIKLVPVNVNEFTNAQYPIAIDPTISWVFSTSSEYTVSDPAKIEVTNGVARLVNNAGSYATDNPYVVSNNGVVYQTLSGFTETLGTNNQGSVQYQISNTQSTWYSQSWSYKQKVNLTGISSNQTDYQVKIVINTSALIAAGKMQSACQDLRVTDSTENLLNHWIETGTNGCNTTSTNVWVKVPSVSTSGTNLNVYYGNPNIGDVQSGSNVFLFFDDFSSGSMDLTKWTWTASASASITNGELTIAAGSAYSKNPVTASNQNTMYEMRAKWASTAGGYSGLSISSTQSINSGNANKNKLAMLITNATTDISLRAFAASGNVASYDVTDNSLQYTPTANTYSVAGFSYDTTNLRYYQNRSVTNTYSSSASYAPYMFLGYFAGTLSPSAVNITDVTIDYVLARKFVTTEPTVTVNSEESRTSGSWYWWNGSAWTLTTNGYTESNTASVINANISTFPSQAGTGSLRFKAFLHADNSTQPVELDAVTIDYYSATAPTISSLSSTSGSTVGETDVTINGTNFNTNSATRTFTYTGADQTYTVPAGVSSIRVKMWGAGGGGGNKGSWTFGYQGGGGGYTEADIAVTPGQTYTVMVGQGGNSGLVGNSSYTYGGGGPNCGGNDCQYGGQGGGRSAIRVNNEDILTAGGGGGGGSTIGSNSFEYGGGGGGTVGEDGVSPSTNAYAGKGGTQVAGGAAGSGTSTGASAGQKYLGGRPNSPTSYGGSGGGGWYGGGGGAYTGSYMGGGGGGSGYIGGAGVTNGLMVGAVNRTQARNYDLDNGGAGLGGNVSAAGANGKVIIDVLPKTVTVGGIAARNIRVIDANTIIVTIPGHLPGSYDVEVTNPDGQKAVLTNGYTYLAPQVTSLNKTSGTSMGGEDVTITGVNFDDSIITSNFSYTGADQSYTVPEGVTSIKVKMWGAGGGGGNKGSWTYGYPGGAGGYTEANLAVTPGQVLIVVVGQGGNSGLVGNSNYSYGGGGPNCGGNDCQYGGQGGGRSAIKIGTEDILTAGGGGGGGSSLNNISDETGGAGGGLTGGDGISAASNAYAGKGGTQSAGGAAGSGSSAGASVGQKYIGGRPNSPTSYGGSGGGGYYGGGGGAYTTNYMGGGGGGSSYIGGAGVSNGIVLQAKGSIQPKYTDFENAGAGAGGLPATAGQNGRVVIQASQINVKFGGVAATNVRFTNSTTIVATTPAHSTGLVDVVVTNGDGQTATLANAFTYTGPTITSVSPTSGTTSGGDTVTISGTDFSKSIATYTYGFASTDQYFVVPDGVSSIYVKMWGAGGGGGGPGNWSIGYAGGGGGYTEGFVSVNPGDVITVVAGAGGGTGVSKIKFVTYGGGGYNCVAADANSTNCIYGGQGGGRAAIRINGQEILTAGGGGGGGSSRSSIHRQLGGAGGGLIGQRGIAEDLPYYGGNGGTQSAGGTAYTNGGNGSQFVGGSWTSASTYGGSGGGGYYGGGTGSYAEPNTMGGGGGGSSYIGGAGVTNGIALQGRFNVQAKSTDFENAGAGAGGAANSLGQDAKVVIYALPLKVSFGGVPASEIQYVNKNTISVKTPENAVGTVDVTVVNPDGTTYTLPNAYTYNSINLNSVSPTSGPTTGGTSITISGSNFAAPKTTTFDFSGVEQTYTVPAGVTSIKVKMWGAGGGGGNAGGWTMGHPGGGGGYSEADLSVTPGQVLNVLVGAGGHGGNIGAGGASYGGGGASCVNVDCRYGGQGGGRSAIRLNGEDILTAGGGGAGGSTSGNTLDQSGGAGGGLLGENGYSAGNILNRGIGGGQSSGGAGGVGTGSNGNIGTKYTGGSTTANSYGGGGGGGWYGGGAGSYTDTYMGGGGGGSSYIGYGSVLNAIAVAGNKITQAYASDTYNDTAGRGGLASYGGISGKVVIITNPISVNVGGIPAKAVTYVNSTTITAITPTNTSGVKDIVVTNSDGITTTLAGSYTYTGSTVSGASPNSGSASGGTTVTITGSNLAAYLSATTYDYYGRDQHYIAPENVSQVKIKAWGAGGGGGNPGGWNFGFAAGGGGYTTSLLPVTKYQDLIVMVGAGGYRGSVSPTYNLYGGAGNNCNGSCTYAGQGGGRSAIRISGEDILTAGGGGGGGSSRSGTLSQIGGGGGGLLGQDGQSLELPNARGKGGTQSAGGSGGSSAYSGGAGSKYQGGSPYSSYGGSGGGGWYGGGAGGYQESNTMGGGGGGSSYIGYPSLINPSTIAANYNVQANSSDPDNGGAGAGGAANTNGQPGKVVIYTSPIDVLFGSERATNVEWVDANTIVATTSANTSGTKDITVVTPDGENHVLPGSFTFVAPPAITTISPNKVYYNGGTTVTITGTDFVATPTVKFDGVDATSVTFINSTTITAVAPAHAVGYVNVKVINPDGLETTLNNGVEYTSPAPVISNINPVAGPTAGGNSVTITGQNFARKTSYIYSTNGLVGYWPMNSDSGTAINDQSGNNLNGTATSVSATNGYVSLGRQFSISGYISVPNNSLLTPSSALTLQAWIKPTNFTDYRVIAGKFPWTSNYSYQMSTTPTGAVRVDISNNGSSYVYLVSQTTLTAGQWANVAFTWDGSTVKIYINGVQDANTLSFSGTLYANSTAFEIGRPAGGSSGTTQYFNGVIDEVMLYNRALFLGEIQQNYRAASAITFRDGFQSHFKFDEPSGQTITNSIPFGQTGVLGDDSGIATNDPTRLSDASCKFSGCLSFAGNSQPQYVNVLSNFNQINNISFSMWFKTTGTSMGLLGQASSVPTQGAPASFVPVLWILSDGKLRAELYTGNSVYLTTANAVNDGQWHHVVLTGNNSTQSLYLDNVLVGSRSGALLFSWWNYTTLGTAYTDTGRGATITTWAYFNGQMDDVRVFGRYLDATDVDAIYNNSYAQVPDNIDVYFDGRVASNINLVDSTTITMDAPEGDGGPVDVVVSNSDGQSATATNGYRYIYDRFAFISSPLNVKATQPGMMVVQAQDINGNPVVLDSNVTLNLTSSSTSGFFALDLNEDESTRWDYNSVTINAGSSTASFYYKDNQKGTPTITADSGVAESLPATQQATIKSKYQFIITGVTTPIKVGVPSSVTVISTDYNGTPLHDYTGTISFSSNDPATILPANFTFDSSMLGEHTFVNGVTMVTQGEFCVSATDVDDSDITGSQCNIVVNPPDSGTIAKLKILNGNQTIPLDGRTTEITVQAQDIDGIGIPVPSITPIYFYSDSATGQFSLDGVNWSNAPFSTNIPAYATSKNFFYRDSSLGAHQIVVRDDSVANTDGSGTNVGWENDTATITTAVGSASKLALTGVPANLSADTVSSAISISMQDIAGNNLTATQDKNVYLTSANNSILFSENGISNFTNTLSTKILTGNLTAVVYVKSAVSGATTITLSDAYPADGATGLVDDTKNINITAGAPAKIVVTTAPSEVVAGQASDVFTVQLRDANNNPAPANGAMTLYLSANNSNATFSTTSFGALVTSLTIPNGSDSVSFYFKQTKYFTSQTITIADTIGGFGAGGITDVQTTVSILPGAPASLAILEASPYAATAGAAAGPFTAVLNNAYGVEIPSTSDLQLYLYTNSSASIKEFSLLSAPWTPVSDYLLPTGQSRFTFYYKDSKSGTTTIKVSDDNNSSFEFGLTNASINLNIAAATPASVKFTSTSQTAEAGIATGIITVTLYDQYNNIATTNSNRAVGLSSNSATGRFDTASNGAFNGSITSVTITSGQSSRNFYYKDTTIGTPTITATSSGLTGDSQQQTIIAGNVVSYAITATSTSLTAGNVLDKLTLRTYNSGNVNIPVPSAFSINLQSSNVTGKFDTASNGSFDGSVTAVVIPINQNSVDFYYKDTKSGTATITASKTSYTSKTINITVSAAAVSKLVFRDALPTLNIGQQSSAIYVQSQDQYGNVSNVVSNTTVYLHSSSSNYKFYNQSNAEVSSITLSGGASQTQFSYKDFVAGTSTLTVSDYVYPDTPNQGLTNDSKDITINYGAPAKIQLESLTNDLQVGVATPITVKLLNAYDQEVPATSDTLINLSATTGTGKFDTNSNGSFSSNSLTIPNGNSRITVYYKDITAGPTTVTAAHAGFTSGTVSYNLQASGVYRLVFDSAVQSVTAGVASNVYIVKFRDEYGNYTVPSSQLTIDLSSTEASAQFAESNSGPWTSNSITVEPSSLDARFYYKDAISGTKTISINSNLLVGDTQSVTVNANIPASMQFVPNQSQTIAGQIASGAITVVLFDQYGNVAKPSSSVTLNLSSDSTQYEFSTSIAPWNNTSSVTINSSSSQAVFYYKDWIIGNPTITVADNSNVMDSITLQMTIIASDASKIVISSDPITAIVNTPSTPITFYVADNNNYKTQFSSDSQVTVTSSSAGGQFSIDNGQTWSSSLTFNILASSDTERSFIYVDSIEGNPVITISSAGLTSAQQTETLITGTINKVAIYGDNTITAGVPLTLTMQTLNNNNDPVSVDEDTIISLDSTSLTGEFSLSDSNWNAITEFTLARWQNQKTIYYKDTVAGSTTITINSKVDLGWTAGVKLLNVDSAAYSKILFLQHPASVVADTVSTQFSLQTVDQFGNLVGTATRDVYIYGPASSTLSLNGTDFVGSTATITLNNGEYVGTFYYKDVMPGTKTITASDKTPLDNPDTDIINASVQINVQGQTPTGIRITTQEYTGLNKAIAGNLSGVITIEAYKEDNSPAIIGTPVQIDLTTTPALSGVFKLTNNINAASVTTATIATGSTSVNVYFTTNVAGTYTLNFNASGITGTSQSIEFQSANPHHFVFMTAVQTKGAGIESDQFRVALQDIYNNLTVNQTDLTLNLTSSSTTGVFSVLNGSNWIDTSSITLTSGTSDIYFYYKDTVSGTFQLTVDEAPSAGIQAGVQSFTVTSGSVTSIKFLTAANNLQVNQASNAMTVALYDIFGNITTAQSNLTVYMYSSSNGGVFASSNSFASTISSTLITAGSSSATFYYKDSAANSAVVTVSDQSSLDNPDIGIINAAQTQTINWGTATKLSFVNSSSSVSSGDAKLLQLRLLNAYDGIVQTPDQVAVYLSSTSETGKFSFGQTFNANELITEFTIEVGSNGADLYYKDTTAASVTVTASDISSPAEVPDTGIVNATQTFTVQPGNLNALVFVTTAQSLTVGQVSTIMTVQARDIYGNITTVDNSTNLYLYTTSATGKFSASTDFSAGSLINYITLAPGGSSISFYYKDLTYVSPASSPKITVSNQFPQSGTDDSITDATQIQTINSGNISQMTYTAGTDLGTTIAGTPATPITVQFKNQYGIEIPLTTNKTLYFFSTLGGAQFAGWNGSACSTFGITQLDVTSSNSRFTFCYKSTQSGSSTITVSDTNVSSPDTAWTNATGTITVDAGSITQLAFTNANPQTVVARHPSAELKIEARNQYGNPTAVSSNKTIFLRSSSSTGEFALTVNGTYGVNFATILAGQNTVSAYYRDSTVTNVTPVTLTAADNLPITPDINWTNATLNVNIQQQVVSNFLVTNISDPQIQGNSSSVVVMARDSENYIVDWYTGTISFTSSDANAILPATYTFAASDKGIKTFTNSVAFASTGEQYVRATDTNGITGEQNNITVNSSASGPVTQVRFKDVASPMNIQKDVASNPISIQLRDSNANGSNAGIGGFQVRISSTSATGQFASSANGPWSNSGVFTVPQNFNTINFYYKDSTAGNYTLTASDWISNSDDVGISNDTLSIIVNTININVSTTLQVNNNTHYYANSPIIFAKDDTGSYTAKADFQISTTDAITGNPKTSNLVINWKDANGNTLQSGTASSVISSLFNVASITGTAVDSAYSLDLTATATDGSFVNSKTTNIPVSGWTTKVDYNPDNINIGQPIEFTVQTKYNGTLTDASNLSVNIKDNNGTDVNGSEYIKTLPQLTKTSAGTFTGTLSSSNLTLGNPYYLYSRIYDNSNNTLAEDNNNDIFFENNPTVAPKNFSIEKVLTSTAPAAETFDLKFTWTSSDYALEYNLYRSTDKFNQLFQDSCTLDDIKNGHRSGDVGAIAPLCDSIISQNVNVDDSTSWVKMATVSSPASTYTIPWSTIQSSLTSGSYYYILRAQNVAGESAYSTMLSSGRRTYTFSSVLANTNWFSMPYDVKYKKASDIVLELEGGTGSSTNQKINTVTLWRANTQDVESYKYNALLNKWVGTDFTINPGDGISLILSGNTASFDWTVVGSDTVTTKTFTSNSGIPNRNWFSIPYSTKFRTASDIVKNIEGGLTTNQKISEVSIWDPSTQTKSSFTYFSNLNTWLGADFIIDSGDGISIVLSGNSSSIDFTPYLIVNPNK